MDISVKLSKDFERCLDDLKKKYGEDFEKLNGLHASQLDFSEFIDNFVDKETVADASIDSSSNVHNKDIVTLRSEMSKPHEKMLAYNKIFYEMKKTFGLKTAKRWLEEEWNRSLYLHDANSSTFVPYCFSGDTKIMTKQGIKELRELVGQDIQVINKHRGWENATVEYFGKQPLRKLVLERRGNTKEIYVTGNHRWFVKTPSGKIELTTDELKPGMKIPFNTTKAWSLINPSPFGIAHGFFTGDGDKGTHLRASFCGDKTSLLPYFTPANVSGTEKELTTGGIPNYFRELPSISENISYLYGWLVGYFAADGCIDTHGRCTISSTKRENLECVRDILCVLGMPVNDIKYQDRVSNLTGEIGRVYHVSISRHYLRDDFFIRPTHKANWDATKNKDTRERSWIVKSVEETDIEDDVYCAVTEYSGSFTLDNNILTHNCFAYDLKRVVDEGLFYLEDHKIPEPAKHLETFVDFCKEFISFVSNRTSGACGLPNLIPYMWWYWRNDVDSGHYPRNQDEETFAKSEIQRFIYGTNQPYTRDGIQSAFVNSSIFDSEYFDALFGGMEFPDGRLAIDYKDEIMQFEKWFLEEMADIKDKGRMFTFPVNSISLLKKDGKFIDKDFAKWASAHNRRWNDSNFFCDEDVTSLSNCCRLKSNIKDLGYFNSIGGTALKVGSVKVSTINLARIAYESEGDEKKFLKILKDRLILNMKLLHVIRNIIKRNVDKGLLPNFVDGIIDFEHLYNTVGLNGIYETMKTFGYTAYDESFNQVGYTENAFEFGRAIFEVCHNTIAEFVKDKDYMVNIEQVPGETAAVKFQHADQLLYPEKVVNDLPLYGNQWIPLGIPASLKDRINICATFDGYCDGGSICHVNIDAPFSTDEQAWDMLNYITNEGVTYFAFNSKMSTDDNGHLFYGDICPECREGKTAEYTRTVGFYTKTASWSKERKEEFTLREWMPMNEKGVDA